MQDLTGDFKVKGEKGVQFKLLNNKNDIGRTRREKAPRFSKEINSELATAPMTSISAHRGH